MKDAWWCTSTPPIRHIHSGSDTSLHCTYHLSVFLSREEVCQLTSLYEVQDSTFTNAGIGTGDDSRLSIQPGLAAVSWATNHRYIPLCFLPQNTLLARCELLALGAQQSAVQRRHASASCKYILETLCVILSVPLFLSLAVKLHVTSQPTYINSPSGTTISTFYFTIKCQWRTQATKFTV